MGPSGCAGRVSVELDRRESEESMCDRDEGVADVVIREGGSE